MLARRLVPKTCRDRYVGKVHARTTAGQAANWFANHRELVRELALEMPTELDRERVRTVSRNERTNWCSRTSLRTSSRQRTSSRREPRTLKISVLFPEIPLHTALYSYCIDLLYSYFIPYNDMNTCIVHAYCIHTHTYFNFLSVFSVGSDWLGH